MFRPLRDLRGLDARAVAASLADSDNEVPIPCNAPCSALVLCDSDDEVLFLRPVLSCPSSTLHPFVLPHPALQACGYRRNA
jgi:hypothetical protein